MYDVLIINGTIIDGTGRPSYKGTVAIKNGLLHLNPDSMYAKEIINAEGLTVCPGFIDAHSHSDLILGSTDVALFKTTQGITTECVGQCGLSVAPVTRNNLVNIQNMLTVGTTFFPEDMKNWDTFDRFLYYADEQKLTTNIKMYIGHSTLRISVMGMENRPATAKELDTMKGILREAMESGAAGLSTGLIYPPSVYATEEEIMELVKVIYPFDGIYASHIRSESNRIVQAVEEAINVGRQIGVRVNLSHHKVLGKPNWGKQKETLQLVHDANDEGLIVFLDQYPYTANMTSLNATIPPWYLSDGFDVLTKRLRDPKFRKQIRAEMQSPDTEYDNYYLNAGGWSGVYVCFSPYLPEAEGKSIADYADSIGQDPWDVFFDICVKNNCKAGGVYMSMSEDDVIEIIQDPYCIVGSDGLTRSWKEKGHPRASGSFPRAITYFVKEKKIFKLEKIIQKMTGQSAAYLALKNKGLIKENYDADLVIFDYENLRDTATYANPNSITEGIEYVFVNGEKVYQSGELTGKAPGKMLRHKN